MQTELVQNKTQKEAFLKYIQKMDIEMLELILDDSITYFGASKSLFLEKLAYIFKQVKLGGQSGDIRIRQNKKQSNKYYLLLHIFCNAIEFIIEEKDGIILKISGTKIIKSKDDIEMLSPLVIFFGDDEKADFKPTNEYVMNLYRCTKAYEELINDKIKILTSQDISKWLKKHKDLYAKIANDYLFFKFNDFKNIFFLLEFIFDMIKNYDEVKSALNSFDDSSFNNIHNWLDNYDRLFFCELQGFQEIFSDIDLVNNTLKCKQYSNIYFKGDDFLAVLKFNELYLKYY
jgi:hypothetical protein